MLRTRRRRGRARRRGEIPTWAVIGALLVVAGGGVAPVVAATRPPAPALTCVGGDGQIGGFGAVELSNAATIVAIGREMEVPERGWVVATATAMQESHLRNLDYGDRDSLGLFQQRPSMGWGSPAQVRDPAYSARKFYEGLLGVPGWPGMPLTVAAQAVQRSGFPSAYAKWEGPASSVVAATTCTARS